MRRWNTSELAVCEAIEQRIAGAGYTLKVRPMEPGWMMQVCPTVRYVYVNDDAVTHLAPSTVISMLDCAALYIERARATGNDKTGNAYVDNLLVLE